MVWVEAPGIAEVQVFAGWGDETDRPWHPDVLVHEGADPLLNVEPWHSRHDGKPGAPLAAAPCWAAARQPAGWPTDPWQRVLLKQPLEPTASPGRGAREELAPDVWQAEHFPALLVSVVV